MNIPVFFDKEENGEVWLSDETQDHRLTLRCHGDRVVTDGEYKPSDILAPWDPPLYAATIAYTWACENGRTEQELAWAREYLSQWPEGPQADPESLKSQKRYAAGMKRAVAELGVGPPYLNEMSEFELRAKIEEMGEKLAACAPGSPMADVLKTRINAAKIFLHIDDPESPRFEPED
ncbi:MAG: hypothetical protein ACFUZC_07430 [Chthoniobacteraceae bacterium]